MDPFTNCSRSIGKMPSRTSSTHQGRHKDLLFISKLFSASATRTARHATSNLSLALYNASGALGLPILKGLHQDYEFTPNYVAVYPPCHWDEKEKKFILADE